MNMRKILHVTNMYSNTTVANAVANYERGAELMKFKDSNEAELEIE